MERMLYFSDGTAGLDATTEGLCVPVGMIKSMEPRAAGESNIYFESLQSHVQTAATATKNYDYVTIHHTANKFKEVAQAITQAINGHPNSDGFIVICDALNSVFCSTLITDCQITYVDTNTDPDA